MNYDQWKLTASPALMYYETEEEQEICELCELPASDWVDIDPVKNPGTYLVHLCPGCAAFERARVNKENKQT